MPSGQVHFWMNLGLLAPVAGGIAYVYDPVAALAFASGYVVATTLLTPDLDLNGPNLTTRHLREWFGWPGQLYAWYWKPYGWFMIHRGGTLPLTAEERTHLLARARRISHGHLLGTLSRLVYSLPLVFVAFLLFHYLHWPWPQLDERLWFSALAGAVLADSIHIWADELSTSWKTRAWRKR